MTTLGWMPLAALAALGVLVVVVLAFAVRRVTSPEQRRLRQQRRRKRQYLRAGMAHLEKPTSGSDTHPGGSPNTP